MKIEESLNVKFDETPPPSKTSPLVDDDLDEDQTIKVAKTKVLENDIEDETLKIDKIEDLDRDGERGFNYLTFALVTILVTIPKVVLRHSKLFEVGLKPSWEFDQQRSAIIVGSKEMAFRNFIYAEDDDDLAFLPKEPSPGFGIGSLSASVNTKPPKDVEEPEVQPVEVTTDSGESPKTGVFVVHPGSVAARIREMKCKTRRGFSKPTVKRKLASESSSSCVVRAKNSASKDDAPFLSIFDDDESLPDCFELKDASACHLKISAITPPAWKVIEKIRDSRFQHESCVLAHSFANHEEPFDYPRVKGYRSLYQKEHTHASNDFVTATFPWLDEFVADAAALIEALLSKKPPTLLKPAPLRTQMPMPSSQKATPSSAPSINPISPPANLLKLSPTLPE
ncbi:hypothetical protein Tco_0896182 [Tanacetum coccineum]